MEKIKFIIVFIMYLFSSSFGLILFKLGSSSLKINFHDKVLNLNLNLNLILGIFLYLFSFFVWLVIVSTNKLSLIFPLSVALINIIVLFGSFYILGESITKIQIVGLIIILAGIFLITTGGEPIVS